MAKSSTVAFSCSCGKVRGRIDPASPRSGSHLVCHCRDCRAAERYLGATDPAPNGVDLFQTSPETIHFETGMEHMAILRLSPKGPLRWYAACCKSPMFNTLARAGLPFVTALTARTDDPAIFGPVIAQSFVPQPGGPPKHKNGARMVWGVVSRMISARLSGRWKQTPFFDIETGLPTAPIHLVSKEERQALYD